MSGSGEDDKTQKTDAVEYVAPPSIEDVGAGEKQASDYEAPPAVADLEVEKKEYVYEAPPSIDDILEEEKAQKALEEPAAETAEEEGAFAAYEAKNPSVLEETVTGYENQGLMGVYAKRLDLLEALGGSFLNWFPPLRKMPEISYNFIVLAGIDFLGEFKSVEGITYEHSVFEYAEGGRNHASHLLPYDKPSSRGELKLSWGAVTATSLQTWVESIEMGKEFRREVYVLQLARDGWPTRIMRFGGCWPKDWDGANLNTDSSEWAIQTLTLVYDRYTQIVIPFDLGDAMRSAGLAK